MKKLFFFLVCVSFIALMAFPVLAVSLSLIPSASPINPGDPLSVDVNVGELGNFSPDSLGAFLIEVTFDSNVLTFNSVTYGNLLGDPDPGAFETLIFTNLGAGLVSLDEGSFLSDIELDALQPDSFTLATLMFSGNLTGTTTLGFGLTDLSNAAFPASPLNVDTFNTANVTVDPSSQQPIPEPGTMLLLGTGLLGLAAWRFRANRLAG